jgi:hypothetical protein
MCLLTECNHNLNYQFTNDYYVNKKQPVHVIYRLMLSLMVCPKSDHIRRLLMYTIEAFFKFQVFTVDEVDTLYNDIDCSTVEAVNVISMGQTRNDNINR